MQDVLAKNEDIGLRLHVQKKFFLIFIILFGWLPQMKA